MEVTFTGPFEAFNLSVGKEDKERVVASTRCYLDASDPEVCNAIFAEAHNEWGRLIHSP